MIHRWAVVSSAMNFHILQKTGNLLTSWAHTKQGPDSCGWFHFVRSWKWFLKNSIFIELFFFKCWQSWNFLVNAEPGSSLLCSQKPFARPNLRHWSLLNILKNFTVFWGSTPWYLFARYECFVEILSPSSGWIQGALIHINQGTRYHVAENHSNGCRRYLPVSQTIYKLQ